MKTKPADWHNYDPKMTISRLLVQECLHEPDGSFPITVSCDLLGGEILLEIVRRNEHLFAIYYFSSKTAELWASTLGFRFIENGWLLVEGTEGKTPTAVGKAVPRNSPEILSEAVCKSLEWLNPETVKTGIYSDANYRCPKD